MVRQLVLARATRALLLVLSLGSAAAGVGSMQAPPSVSEWVDMPVAEPMSRLPSECGFRPAVPGRLIEFISARGDVYSPAVRIGGEIPLVSYRMLDRDIEGVIDTTLVSFTEQVNIVHQMRNLLTYPYILEKFKAEKLKIYGWYFLIETGEIFNYNAETKTFDPVK